MVLPTGSRGVKGRRSPHLGKVRAVRKPCPDGRGSLLQAFGGGQTPFYKLHLGHWAVEQGCREQECREENRGPVRG